MVSQVNFANQAIQAGTAFTKGLANLESTQLANLLQSRRNALIQADPALASLIQARQGLASQAQQFATTSIGDILSDPQFQSIQDQRRGAAFRRGTFQSPLTQQNLTIDAAADVQNLQAQRLGLAGGFASQALGILPELSQASTIGGISASQLLSQAQQESQFQRQLQFQQQQLAFQRRQSRSQAKGARRAALGSLVGSAAGSFLGPIGLAGGISGAQSLFGQNVFSGSGLFGSG